MSTRTIESKACSKCGQEKPFSEYHKQKAGLFGLRAACKVCYSAWRREYCEEHKSELQQRRADYYQADREAERARVAAYRAANPEAVKASTAKGNAKHRDKQVRWAKENPDKVRAAGARWYAKHAEEARAARAARYRQNPQRAIDATMKWARANKIARASIERNRRARIRVAEGRHGAADVAALLSLQRGRCACCRRDIRAKFHVDHVVALANGGRNDRSNLQLLCPGCNHAKGAKCSVRFMQERGFLL